MPKRIKKFEKLLKDYRDYAERNGFHLNSDQKVIDYLIKVLVKREEKYGKKYCPCRRITGIEEKDKKIICPCFYHKEEIEKEGHCHCFLFVKNIVINKLKVNKSKCAGCGACVETCSFGAIKIGKDGKAL